MADDRGIFVGYRKRDLVLYVFSLALVGLALGALFHGHVVLQGLVVAALVYMAGAFVWRRGFEIDWGSFRLIASGLAAYPAYLVGMIAQNRGKKIRLVGLFAFACLVERLATTFGPASWSQGWMERPFPWQWFVAVHFVGFGAYRTISLVDHLRKLDKVSAVLEDSGWAKRYLSGMGPAGHVFHGYVTGWLSHLCYFAPSIAFWEITKPTLVRELVMFVVSMAMILLRLKHGTADAVAADAEFMRAHEHHHKSRFGFTVFHGHHHDALPSALIAGAGGAAFLENLDRGVYRGDVFDSIVVLTLREWPIVYLDMIAHQYIPGVFPYTRFVVKVGAHHVVHHFGSVTPLGLGFAPETSYRRDNGIARWFVDKAIKAGDATAEQREAFFGVSDAQASVEAPTSGVVAVSSPNSARWDATKRPSVGGSAAMASASPTSGVTSVVMPAAREEKKPRGDWEKTGSED